MKLPVLYELFRTANLSEIKKIISEGQVKCPDKIEMVHAIHSTDLLKFLIEELKLVPSMNLFMKALISNKWESVAYLHQKSAPIKLTGKISSEVCQYKPYSESDIQLLKDNGIDVTYHNDEKEVPLALRVLKEIHVQEEPLDISGLIHIYSRRRSEQYFRSIMVYISLNPEKLYTQTNTLYELLSSGLYAELRKFGCKLKSKYEFNRYVVGGYDSNIIDKSILYWEEIFDNIPWLSLLPWIEKLNKEHRDYLLRNIDFTYNVIEIIISRSLSNVFKTLRSQGKTIDPVMYEAIIFLTARHNRFSFLPIFEIDCHKLDYRKVIYHLSLNQKEEFDEYLERDDLAERSLELLNIEKVYTWLNDNSEYTQDVFKDVRPDEKFEGIKTLKDFAFDFDYFVSKVKKSPTGCYFEIKGDIFYNDPRGIISWALDSEGRVYVKDSRNLGLKQIVANTLPEFLTRCTLEN